VDPVNSVQFSNHTGKYVINLTNYIGGFECLHFHAIIPPLNLNPCYQKLQNSNNYIKLFNVFCIASSICTLAYVKFWAYSGGNQDL
jgi:hypothetical protein